MTADTLDRERRERIEVLSAAGWTAEQIAPACGLSPEVLKRDYADELEFGPERCRRKIEMAEENRARKGSKRARLDLVKGRPRGEA